MEKKQLQRWAGFVLAGTLWLGSTTAHASYDELLKTLEGNKTLTAEQATALRGKAPKYRVRPANSVVKDLQLRGRVQTQAAYVYTDNDEGSDDYSTLEIRRLRMGMRGTLFDNVRAQLEANLVPGADTPSMRSAFLQWREYKPAYIKLGHDKPLSSIEENTSSAEILTIERTMINSLVAAPGPVNGLSLEGNHSVLTYGAGIYTDSQNINPANANSKYMLNAMLGLQFDKVLEGVDTLLLRANYLNSDDPSGIVGSKFDDILVLGTHFAIGKFDLRAEYMLAEKNGNDSRGWYVMPSMHLTEKLQAVLRFEQAETDKSDGIRAPSRYSRNVPALAVRETKDDEGKVISKLDPQRGDKYRALYAGLNYYFSGHGHKLMLGVEASELENTKAGTLQAITASTAWRMLF